MSGTDASMNWTDEALVPGGNFVKAIWFMVFGDPTRPAGR